MIYMGRDVITIEELAKNPAVQNSSSLADSNEKELAEEMSSSLEGFYPLF